ncbi:hypothetical protein ACFP65_10790 [Marinilactibacillus sp. GCM10026970]|uniref:hypothetical protein n=1 Tax=Marinilactibacillus sp. GCM10026970 TaxID=3252642 RepID=UPI00361543D7
MNAVVIDLSFKNVVAFVVFIIMSILFDRIYSKIFLRESYTSIYDVLIFKNKKESVYSFVYRILIIVLINVISIYLGIPTIILYGSLILGSVLKVWPSIINNNLIFMPYTKNKTIALLRSLIYVLSTFVILLISEFVFLPILFEQDQYYITENSGIQILFSLASFIFAGTIELFFSGNKPEMKYLNIESFKQEVLILNTQLYLESEYIDMYNYEIQKYSNKYNISESLLRGILMLENVNRGSFFTKISERILCRLFPRWVIRTDRSIGIAQIKVSTAKELLKKSPEKFLSTMTNTDFSIKLCAKYLGQLVSESNNPENIYQYLIYRYMGYANNTKDNRQFLYEAALEAIDQGEIRCYINCD